MSTLKEVDSSANKVNESQQEADADNKKSQKKIISSSGIDLKSINPEHLLDYSYGLVIGAGIGDSIGSFLEFSRGNSLDDIIDAAMTMPGGGTWGTRIKSGQVTDDTELAISLCRGIVDMIIDQANIKKDNNNNNDNDNNDNDNIHHIYDSYYIAKQYERWFNSDPFDIGGCTSSTLSKAPYIDRMKEAAFNYNEMMKRQYKGSGNMANGSLMRCMPLIVYGYKLNYQCLYDIMSEDSSLTHLNNVVFIANTIYAISAQYLLQTHDDKKNNKEEEEEEEKKNDDNNGNDNDSKRNIMAILMAEQWLKQQIEINVDKDNNEYFKEINKWLIDCKQDDISKLHEATKFIGFVKIAFQRAFYHLWNGTDFKTAIKMTISEGGDTDTNCCIVGGLMGAYWGLNKIPKTFVDVIMDCKPAEPLRDNQFQTKLYINSKYIENIIKNAPDIIKIKMYKIGKDSDDDDDDDDDDED